MPECERGLLPLSLSTLRREVENMHYTLYISTCAYSYIHMPWSVIGKHLFLAQF